MLLLLVQVAAVHEISECGPPSRGESISHILVSTRRLLISALILDA